MKISYSQLLNIVLVAILVSSVFFMNTRSTIETKTASAETYDPWLDYNEDGYIGIDDIFSTASNFGAEGDPTKNVNVTNWQISSDVNVWWMEDIVPGGLMSPAYNTNGFGHLHILAYGDGLSGAETLTVHVRGRLPNATGTTWRAVTAYTITLTSTTNYADISLSVPSEVFYFTAPYDAASTCQISLSFYLTWA